MPVCTLHRNLFTNYAAQANNSIPKSPPVTLTKQSYFAYDSHCLDCVLQVCPAVRLAGLLFVKCSMLRAAEPPQTGLDHRLHET